MKKQPIEQFISLDNGWTLALSKGYQVFRNEHEVILLDVDYDTMGAFVFEEDGVIVKKNRLASGTKNPLRSKTNRCPDATGRRRRG